MHPLFAAIDAALAQHGLPCPAIYISRWNADKRPMVTVTLGRDPLAKDGQGYAETAVEAYALAQAAQEAAKRNIAEIERARDVLAAAGLDPDLVKG